MKTIKTIIRFLTLISLLLGFTSIMQAATGTIALGDMEFFKSSATVNNFLTGSTTDGNTEKNSSGWQIYEAQRLSGESQNITWSWLPHSVPTLAQGESISHYTYTVNLHNGLSGTNVNFLLKSYSLALGDPPFTSDNFTTITDYQSFSNTQEAQDHDHTLSVDPNGLITTTKANITGIADIHTFVFQSTSLSNQIRLVIHDPVEAGWDEWFSPAGSFLFREITGSVTANVVPEPSTYALIMGLLALSFAFKRRK